MSISKIRKSARYTDRWLLNRQDKHIRMVEESIKQLQRTILNDLSILRTTPNGHLEGIKVNLKQAQKLHQKIISSFDGQFSKGMQKVINDFTSTEKMIQTAYSYLDESVAFTSTDRKVMQTLREGYYRSYLSLGKQHRDQVIQSVYNQVLGNGSFSTLVETIEGALVGQVSAVGRPLAFYARTYAKDMIMNFHNEVNLIKAEDADIKHFLYVGNIIESTRSFCKKRAGKYYTKKQINSWNYKWPGKSGPALTHRGGFNCRHHWQPIKPEWLDGEKKIDVADWFKEN